MRNHLSIAGRPPRDRLAAIPWLAARFRRQVLLSWAGCAAATGAFALSAQAQQSDSTAPRHTYELTVAGARNQMLKTRSGRTWDRDLYMVTLRMRRQLAAGPRVDLVYVAELVPVAVSTRMPFYESHAVPCPRDQPCLLPALPPQSTSHASVYGGGISPLGLGIRVSPSRHFSFSARGTAGMIYFTRRIPDPGEKRLNFNLDAGISAELRLARELQLVTGFRHNHISNAGRGPVNPGMDSRLFELGLAIGRD